MDDYFIYMKTLRPLQVLIYAAFIFISVINCSCNAKKEESTSPAAATDLPSIPISLIDGTKTSVNNLTGNVGVILFQPDCDHCQNEAKDILNNINAFKNYQLYFISSAPTLEIVKFAKDYNLHDQANIKFAHSESQHIVDSYGSIPAPSFYLYRGGKLIQSFNGEVAIEVVIKYL